MASYGLKNKMQKDEKEMISRNPTEDGARPSVSSTFDDVLRVSFITRHRLNGRKQTTYSPVITAEEAAKTLGRDTDEKLYLCAGFV